MKFWFALWLVTFIVLLMMVAATSHAQQLQRPQQRSDYCSPESVIREMRNPAMLKLMNERYYYWKIRQTLELRGCLPSVGIHYGL